ncbi:MAG: hypothetical protein IPN69_05030 [Acidobacteria bacterium]|nr:hypothetical protein [Acidobacteriota bacterium]
MGRLFEGRSGRGSENSVRGTALIVFILFFGFLLIGGLNSIVSADNSSQDGAPFGRIAVTPTPPAGNSNNQVDESDEEEGDDEVWRLENDEDEAGGRFVRGPEEIRFTNLQLQTKFKHAKDFGITKNYSKAALAEWKLILLDHLNADATVRYENVNYRKVAHTVYFNPEANLFIMVDGQNIFVSAWKLAGKELENFLNGKFVR